MDFFLPILFTAIFVFIILYFKFFSAERIKRLIIVGLFVAKLLAGIGVYVVYTYYFDEQRQNMDMYKYFDGGVIIYNETENNFKDYLRIVTGIQGNLPHLDEIYSKTQHWIKQYNYGLFNDNRTMIRFNALLCLISQGNIYLHIVIMTFLSFLGCFALFKSITKINDANPHALLFATFLIPSCLFWTSGLLKEGLMMFSLGFAVYFLIKMTEKFKIKHLVLFMIFASLLFLSKIYVLPAIAPALLFFGISKKMRKRNMALSFLLILIFSAIFISASNYILGYDVLDNLAAKQRAFINHVHLVSPDGSNIDIKPLKSSPLSFLQNLPQGIINVMFRPFPNEINSSLMIFAFLENIVILGMLGLMIIYFRKFNKERFRFVLFALLFVIVMFSLIGLMTPNIGAIVRYKTPALPFLMSAFFCLTDFDKIKKKWFKKSLEKVHV